MTNKKAYVVVENTYNYDDNYYSPSGGGDPKHVMFDKALAEKIRDDKNFAMINELVSNKERYGTQLQDYCDGLDEEQLEKLSQLGFTTNSYRIESNPRQQLTPEQIKEVIEITGLNFFEVVEVDSTLNSLYSSHYNKE